MKKIIYILIVFIAYFFLSTNIANAQALIKGNINFNGVKIYHFPGCESYHSVVIDERYGEKWFNTEQEARRAGFRKARNCPRVFNNPYSLIKKRQVSCTKRFPGTIYRLSDDRCVCENGLEYEDTNKCEPIYTQTTPIHPVTNSFEKIEYTCQYADGSYAVKGAISGDGYVCEGWGWEPIFKMCPYVEGGYARIGDISLQGNTCTITGWHRL